ncbi:glycoside hydrolase family 130 protein [Paraglaciecola chathamensis]|uniref:4-O-beta-D-mannosyl-D-glucose phosphorylase n=1 Tax=Paraglaciecola chathamensis S18K6 TaxID=1127672 RepID=A0AAV3V6L1_9ALTE|nr:MULTISPECIES: glycosidase-like protein [Paraglaciecola]MBN28237.1 glycosidase [Alteromonadaceae bacterium]GAC12416.1 glycosidase-like protein [Paraglaciecola chathamensis S18K6]|tara:strand:- start:7438 stop:8616 length:1179 start_codon:yes stop_codon:yes gene_type:complete
MNDKTLFHARVKDIKAHHETLLSAVNQPTQLSNGIFQRWQNPVLTAAHTPLTWRYDFDESRNPYFMERIGINATLNAGAIYFNGKYTVVARVEGNDRKSFFAVAQSDNGVDGFTFWSRPINMPDAEVPDTNIYDMRLTRHEDGYIYGLFCTERKDDTQPDDASAAVAQCGIARTKDLVDWQRLPDLVTYSGQQRNVVLHPEFVEGKYALYTRPQDGFISVGGGGGIGWGLCDSMESAKIEQETIIDHKVYHTISEVKNGQGPAPIKTESGWLHLAHGVRNTAAGLRYVLYMFITDLQQPWVITHKPAGYLLAPEGDERVGDVSNVVFSNGWVVNKSEQVFIYYGSSDTRLHVATSTIAQLVDYCLNTQQDGLTTHSSVQAIYDLAAANEGAL